MTDDLDANLVIPDVAEPIIGWRSWRIGYNGQTVWNAWESAEAEGDDGPSHLTLIGFYNATWPKPPEHLTAECKHVVHDPMATGGKLNRPCRETPSKGTLIPEQTFNGVEMHHIGYGCGIYGYATPAILAERTVGPFQPSVLAVWGSVEMWGKVYPHADGYRAQYARVRSIIGWGDGPSRHMAKLYGVPLEQPFADGITEARRLRQEAAERERLAAVAKRQFAQVTNHYVQAMKKARGAAAEARKRITGGT